MVRKLSLLACCLLLIAGVVRAQDGLNLPTELYVLTNAGQVQRYGIGAAGISTVTPDGDFVVDFGVAPDGNWMAYRTEEALTLLNMSSGDSSVIETNAGVPPTRGRGDTLVWSPSGDALAYTTLYGGRVYFSGSGTPIFADLRDSVFVSLQWSPGGDYLAAQSDPNIWWIYHRDGTTLKLTSAIPSSVGLAWVSPSEVVFAPEDGGLIGMNLAQTNAQTPLLDNTSIYALPFVMPDGTLAVFSRQKDDTNTEAGKGQLVGFALDKPTPEPLGQSAIDLSGLRWAPGGQLTIAFRGGVMALVLPATGDGFTLPVSDAVAYSWGPPPLENVTQLKLPTNGYFLTPDTNNVIQVWRLRKDGSLAEPVTAAEADVTVYALSPNERNIAFASGSKVWLQPLTASGDAKSLVDVGQREVRDIAFSPDGTRIAYDTLSTADDPEGGIWLILTNGGDSALILRNGPAAPAAPAYQPPFFRQPQFAPNINALLAVAGQTEATDFTILDLDSKTTLDIGMADDALWLPNGRILAYGNGIGIGDPPPSQAIFTVNPADLTHTELASIPYPARILALREIGGKVRLILGSYLPGPHALNVLDLQTDTGALTPVDTGDFIAVPLLSPDGNFIAGQTHANGPLTFRDLQSGKQVVVGEPANVSHFQWGK
jgi:WD40-like Beta Propeller Repeat